MARKKTSAAGKAHPLFRDTSNLETIGDWLRLTVTCLSRAPLSFGQGLHNPQEEAIFLVSRFLGLNQEDVLNFLNARLTPGEVQSLKLLIARRIDEHVPVAYLVNEAPLGGHQFYVDERVLIPRSYIVELIPDAIRQFAGRAWHPRRILDIGTGSGCLAILAAHAFPDAIVDAVDLSADALDVAGLNVAAHGLADRVHLLRSDLFSGLPDERYDLIIANPPYEPTEVVAEQPAEFDHEPSNALDGGPDGMDCVRRIVAEAGRHLNDRAVLVLELGELQPLLAEEFPRVRHDIFSLSDGSAAVVGIKSSNLRSKAGSSRKAQH